MTQINSQLLTKASFWPADSSRAYALTLALCQTKAFYKSCLYHPYLFNTDIGSFSGLAGKSFKRRSCHKG